MNPLLKILSLLMLVGVAGCKSPYPPSNSPKWPNATDLTLNASLTTNGEFRVVMKNVSGERIYEVNPLIFLWIVKEGQLPVSLTRLEIIISGNPNPVMEDGKEIAYLIRPDEFLSVQLISLKGALVFIEGLTGKDRIYSPAFKVDADISIRGLFDGKIKPAPQANVKDDYSVSVITNAPPSSK